MGAAAAGRLASSFPASPDPAAPAAGLSRCRTGHRRTPPGSGSNYVRCPGWRSRRWVGARLHRHRDAGVQAPDRPRGRGLTPVRGIPDERMGRVRLDAVGRANARTLLRAPSQPTPYRAVTVSSSVPAPRSRLMTASSCCSRPTSSTPRPGRTPCWARWATRMRSASAWDESGAADAAALVANRPERGRREVRPVAAEVTDDRMGSALCRRP